jgi:hypothetical protein
MSYLSQKQLSHLRDLQKSNYKGSRSSSALVVTGLADAVLEMEKIMRVVSLDQRHKIIESATPIALKIYRSIIPVSKETHYFNSWGQDKNKLGIGKTINTGSRVYTRTYAYKIEPGNLKRSVQILSEILKKYKWKLGAVGPHYIKDRGNNTYLNSEQSYNGFYAHMVYGSAKAWRRKIVLKARSLSQIPVFKAMSAEARAQINNMNTSWWK